MNVIGSWWRQGEKQSEFPVDDITVYQAPEYISTF